MSPINGTEALLGSFNWVYGEYNALTHTEDRYVSFYANGSYTFDERYSLTGSIRIDQSNLFGTDPKYQYRIIRKSKFPQNPKRSVRFSGKRTKRSVQKRKARNTQKAETKVL